MIKIKCRRIVIRSVVLRVGQLCVRTAKFTVGRNLVQQDYSEHVLPYRDYLADAQVVVVGGVHWQQRLNEWSDALIASMKTAWLCGLRNFGT